MKRPNRPPDFITTYYSNKPIEFWFEEMVECDVFFNGYSVSDFKIENGKYFHSIEEENEKGEDTIYWEEFDNFEDDIILAYNNWFIKKLLGEN